MSKLRKSYKITISTQLEDRSLISVTFGTDYEEEHTKGSVQDHSEELAKLVHEFTINDIKTASKDPMVKRVMKNMKRQLKNSDKVDKAQEEWD